jgi:hypothetical protein
MQMRELFGSPVVRLTGNWFDPPQGRLSVNMWYKPTSNISESKRR